MTTLMVHEGSDDTGHVTRMGGIPLVTEEFDWPVCPECELPMQFIAQLRLEELATHGPKGSAEGSGTLAVWMCQNDPGMCEEWSATSGGNTARIFPAGAKLSPAAPPTTGETLLPQSSAIGYQQVDEVEYDEARSAWADRTGSPLRDVLGHWGGEPEWLQGEETPDCPSCERAMDLAAQLEEGDHEDGANFGGGGCAYAFFCSPCGEAAFLWQC